MKNSPFLSCQTGPKKSSHAAKKKVPLRSSQNYPTISSSNFVALSFFTLSVALSLNESFQI